MIEHCIKWILSIIAVEAVTEIIINGEIFLPIRNTLSKMSVFLRKLLSCGYCSSVWVAASIAWALPGTVTGYLVIDIIIRTFVLHRLSNLAHELFGRLFARLPFTFVFDVTRRKADEPPTSPIIEVSDGDETVPADETA